MIGACTRRVHAGSLIIYIHIPGLVCTVHGPAPPLKSPLAEDKLLVATSCHIITCLSKDKAIYPHLIRPNIQERGMSDKGLYF